MGHRHRRPPAAGTYPPYSAAVFAFSPAGDKVFVDDGHGAVETWTVHRCSRRGEPPRWLGDITLLASCPTRDGTVIALKTDGSIRRVGPDTGRIVDAPQPFLLSTETFVGRSLPTVRGWPLADRTGTATARRRHVPGGSASRSRTEWGENVVYAPDGSQFASVQPDRIRLWDGRTGAYQASMPLSNVPAAGLSRLHRRSGVDLLPARQHRPLGRGRRRPVLDGGHPQERVGATRLQDRRSQPDACRVGGSSSPTGPTRSPAAVARFGD